MDVVHLLELVSFETNCRTVTASVLSLNLKVEIGHHSLHFWHIPEIAVRKVSFEHAEHDVVVFYY